MQIRRLLWLLALWLASVAAMGALAFSLRLFLGMAGLAAVPD